MDYTNIIWRDGQPFSEMFDDIYFSSGKDEQIAGRDEFEHVFFTNNGLPARWDARDEFVIAELGLGSALNCLLTVVEWLKRYPEDDRVLHYIAIERFPLAPEDIALVLSRYDELQSILDEFLSVYPPPVAGVHSRRIMDGRVVIQFRFLDVNDALEGDLLNVDAWYLDGFSPAKNPGMWSQKLFQSIASNSKEGATCSTYTAAGSVKRNLIAAGFEVSKVKGCGAKREMLVAKLLASQARQFKFSDRPWFNSPPQAVISRKTAIVIGAGIAGLCVAYSLVRRGFNVTVIGSSDDAAHAGSAHAGSENPAAIVYPRLSADNEADSEFYLTAYCYACHVLADLQKQYEKKFWFNTGLLQFYDKTRLSKIIDRYGFNESVLSVADSGETEAVANFPAAGVVLPEMLLKTLKEACGSRLQMIGQRVDGIRQIDLTGSDETQWLKAWSCHTSSGESFQAEVMVVANGSAEGLQTQMTFPIDKIRGQMIILRSDESSRYIDKAINSNCYITPEIDGRHYLGATFSRGNLSAEVDDDESKELLERVNSLGEHVFTEEHIESAWVGFRFVARDRVPVVGAMPDYDFMTDKYSDIARGRQDSIYPSVRPLNNIYVSVAHASRGFTSGFLSAEIVAAQITGEPLPVSKWVLDYINPSRFIVDELKRR